MLSSAFGGNVENSLSVVVVAVADFATLDPLYVDSKVGCKREDLWDIFDKYSINRCLPRINYGRFAIFVHGSERTERARLPSGNLVSRHGIGRGRNPYQSPRREAVAHMFGLLHGLLTEAFRKVSAGAFYSPSCPTLR